MSTFHLESAIAAWRRQYETRHHFATRDLDELERHLRDQTAWLVGQGRPEEDAFRHSVRDLGSVFEAEEEYRKVFWKKLRFRGQTSSELRWRLGMGWQYVRPRIRALSHQKAVSFINLFGLLVALRVHTHYLVLISTGAAIAMPMVYLGITIPVRQFDLDYITVGPGVFLAACGFVVGTAVLSIAKHAWTLDGANPAAVLRGE